MEINNYLYNSYEELLDDLKPSGPLYGLYGSLVYRGQAIDWGLIPSAFREENQKKLFDFYDLEIPNELIQSETSHRFVENLYLAQFFRYANNIGLKLPKSSFKNLFYTNINLLFKQPKYLRTKGYTFLLEISKN